MDPAETALREMLQIAGLPVRPSYRRSEVCAVLGVDGRTFWRMVAYHEPGPDGQRKPGTLESYKTRGHHRVRFAELVDYLRRNCTYERQHGLDGDHD